VAAATKKSARAINKALDKGHIVLLGFNKPGEGQEQYLYDIEHTCRDPGAKSLADEYIAFRKQYSVKDETQFLSDVKGFMKKREALYLRQLEALATNHGTASRIVILRIQDAPEGLYQPPRFGDVIIVWSPCRDNGEMSFEDRSATSPIVVQKLLGWASTNRVLQSFMKLRDAATVNQGPSEPLDYGLVSRVLFNRAVVR
jgi:hypothetical protein